MSAMLRGVYANVKASLTRGRGAEKSHAKAQRREKKGISHKDTKRAPDASNRSAIIARSAFTAAYGDKLPSAWARALFVSLCEILSSSRLCAFA
ncbi:MULTISPECIES: hypothetical protein [unclassified Sphingopyxis]|uniref:hypothetical protein n=1 Tax=unclassified Sphingopyxis TaxID=2614943 RepID=UPI0024AD163A|nr:MULTISPECIES: hypothetical protein [unclassified Sphingopyxis]